jgi:tetratricopeptide (TPR) repeat protein
MSAAVLDEGIESPGVAAALNLVDEEHPWLGLDSFSEETRQYFYGRDEEVAELARRVQRKTLAILFGQSGLGKTSILRAGIVPRLRKEGYCPVYVRIDYSRESPAPSQQIKQAIFKATEALGKWTKAGASVPGESLWEFLHHRDDFLKDERGNTLTPLVIFDQFEEIFTLGQMDDFGRKRAEEFIADLADLVENRPPKAIEMMMETEDSIVERFDFDRADYRILIALREDYLAHLEGLKATMPSITQNRMRLARMTGHQALAAVVKPGGKLVSEEVAESIVRFVAGGAELRNAEVEPSLLSLVCRELNNARVAQKRPEISADLLAGSRDTILNEFYERALVDQPPGVRRFIEDEMLTDSGFRESLAEERVQKGFAAANAMSNALPMLVNRRLLRIEERLDARRVELTHDVLCAVVKASRDARREREAREEAERQLAAQRAREEATKRSLVRTRYVAIGCAVLALGAVVSAIFGYANMKRAQEAEVKALETRKLAEAARGEAEKLITYLLDDFYLELEPFGRLDIVGDLSKRAIAYYSGLPAELRNKDTERNRALALVRYGYVARYQANRDEAEKALVEANGLLAKLRREGDDSELAAIGHALGLAALARVHYDRGALDKSQPLAEESVGILRPLMARPSPSVNLRRAFGNANNYEGFIKLRNGRSEEAVKIFEIARETYRSVDNLAVGDLASAASYAETSAWLMEALEEQGRSAEAARIGEEGIGIATRVLEKSPAHMGAMRSRALLSSGLGNIYFYDLRPRRAAAQAQATGRDWENLVRNDPGNTVAWNNLFVSRLVQAFALRATGDNEGAIAVLKGALDVEKRAPPSVPVLGFSGFHTALRAMWEADQGRAAEARATLALSNVKLEKWVASQGKAMFPAREAVASAPSFSSVISWAEGDFARARDEARKAIAQLQAVATSGESQVRIRNGDLADANEALAEAFLGLKDLGAAESATREALRLRVEGQRRARQTRLQVAQDQTLLAVILARQGKLAEARAANEPALAFHRELQQRGSEDVTQHVALAAALYAAALASPPQAPGLLSEAKRIIDTVPAQTLRTKSMGRVRDWIRAAMAQ